MKSIALATFGVLLAAPAWADPIGMAATVKGPVKVEQNGENKPLRLLQRLEPGAVITVGNGGEAGVVLFGGGRYRLSAGQMGKVTPGGVTGAQKLANLAGPSANAVRLLGNARVGAAVARLTGTLRRLQPNSPGYLTLPNPQFTWDPMQGASYYTFSLLDTADNVVWSVRTTEPTVTYPADGIPLLERRPYLWRVTKYGSIGKATADVGSGIIAFLTPEDAATLTAQVAELQKLPATPGDNSNLLLLAETYRTFGVYGRALEVITDNRLDNEPGIAEAREDMYSEISPLARVLAGQPVKLTISTF